MGRGKRRGTYGRQRQCELSQDERNAEETGYSRGRAPPGLRGREIGMWHARRGRLKREHAGRLCVTLDDRSMRNIKRVLDTHGRDQSKAGCSGTNTGQASSYCQYSAEKNEYSKTTEAKIGQTTSIKREACSQSGKQEVCNQSAFSNDGACNQSASFRQEAYGQSTARKQEPIDSEDVLFAADSTAEFMTDYADNLMQNKLSHLPNSPVEHNCQLIDNPIRNRTLMHELSESEIRGGPLRKFREKLPSFQMQNQVLQVIKDNQVVVISGETGCGKTTQVPQFILDHQIESGKGSTCRIICTQPRRISAISVAERVAEERGEVLGRSVGYSIRLKHALPRDYGSITYCTTGILLRILTSNRHLTDYSHVIVDEVHERDIQTDFLLILLRDLLSQRPDLKVILMSATLNAEHFSDYFYNSAMFNIPGFTFPVTEYYIEDLVDALRYNCPEPQVQGHRFNQKNRQEIEKRNKEREELRQWIVSSNLSVSDAGRHNLLRMDFSKIDCKLVSELIRDICVAKPEGAILVFLPGWSDISNVNKLLQESLKHISVKIIPLHSLMPTREQKDIFQRPPSGVRKIVLSTNIAETSITIDDIVYVINAGKMKLTDYLSDRNMNSLQSKWVSKANARQRRGRAGRVQAGICYHLYTRYHENQLEEYQKPEMVRTRLENVCLDVKLLGQGYVEPFLLKAMNPPSSEAIDSSLELLKTLNALDEEERLTPLGYHLARMPLDPHTGKMVLMAAMFCCLDPVLSIAACLNFKDPFYVPLDKVKEVDVIRRRLSRDSDSDLIMYYNAVKGWEDAVNKSAYCWDHFISANTISMIHKMKGQFAQLLFDIKFISSPDSHNREANRNSDNMALVRAVLCAGLYPNVAKVHCVSKREIPKLTIKTEKGISFHPKSVNAMENLTRRGQWIMFYELIKLSTMVCVMDSTLMPAFPIMFFGGELKLETKGDGEIIPQYEAVVVNDWINFECNWHCARLINKLRAQLTEVLQQKITKPLPTNWDPEAKEGATLQAIIDLLSSEVTVRGGRRT